MQEVRQRLRKFRDMRITIRNIPGFNIGGGNFDIDYVLRGPELTTLATLGEQLRQRAPADGRHARPHHDAASRPARAAGPGGPGAGGRPPGRRRADRHRPPADGRRGPGGLPLPRSLPRPGLRRPAPPERRRTGATPGRSRDSTSRASSSASATLARRGASGRHGAGRRARPPRQRRQDRARPDGVPDRPVGAPAREPAPRSHRARLRPGRPDGRAQAGDRRDEPARRLHHGRLGAGPRVREDVRRVPLGLPAGRDLHVHDPGVPVREPGPPSEHPALPPAGGPLRPVLALVHRATP